MWDRFNMYIVDKFCMGSELKPELEQAIELLKQDGRFDIRRVGDRKIAVNGIVVNLDFTCRDVDRCVERILNKYKYAVRMPLEVLPAEDNDVIKLLEKYPELQVFGVDWVKKWGLLMDRLAEIAEVIRRYPWMADVIRQGVEPNPHPYLVEVYVAIDGSEVCLLLNRSKAFCNGKKTGLVLKFAGYDVFNEKIREIYRCGPQKYAKVL
jgi:hypothetical protein